MTKNKINMASFEGMMIGSFIDKFSLYASFIDANLRWGSRNRSSGRWDGLVGNVSKHFGIIDKISY